MEVRKNGDREAQPCGDRGKAASVLPVTRSQAVEWLLHWQGSQVVSLSL